VNNLIKKSCASLRCISWGDISSLKKNLVGFEIKCAKWLSPQFIVASADILVFYFYSFAKPDG
jgi:hypothetical protein